MMCWDGPTSTPADQPTRDARRKAHEQFDKLWKEGLMSRAKAYTRLAEHMNLHRSQTHMGMFTEEQCNKVLIFVLNQITFELEHQNDDGKIRQKPDQVHD